MNTMNVTSKTATSYLNREASLDQAYCKDVVKDVVFEDPGAMREKLSVLPYDLVPFQEMTDAFVRVAEFGAVKYAPWNWSKGLKRVQILGSLLRHTFAYLRGEDRDRESGLLHTDHILWNAAVLSHNVHWGLEDGRRAEPPRAYKDSGPFCEEKASA